MFEQTLEQLLAGTFRDPDGGAPLGVNCRQVIVADSLEGREAGLLAGLDFDTRLAVVSDENTHAVLGKRVELALKQIGEVVSIVLPGRPHPDMPTVQQVRNRSAGVTALVAVGSGSINDICKYASAQDGKPYAVYATAPSMNGYTSANAAITEHGHKKSLAARTAAGVFMDLSILAAAPKRLIQSGLGDSVCRCTAQADWLLARLLLDQPYREAPFALLLPYERSLLDRSVELVSGGLGAQRLLAQTLTMSGFGMTICGGSYPASQGEHLISHYIEMMGSDLEESFHGEQIGVATMTMARLQEKMLAMDSITVSPSKPDEVSVKAHFSDDLGASCWKEFAKKRLDDAGAEAVNRRLATSWPDMRERIGKVAQPAARIEAALKAAGCPTTPEELGWPRNLYVDAVVHCREIRNRYTFLDLAGDAGLLEAPDFI